MSINEIYTWLTNTKLGVVTLIVALIVVFLLVAAFSERKTKKLYPDQGKKKKG
ncbi:MAG: hypothetical protein FWH40_05080 [Coriobacteriia bacterium]|nr:hypothetical protein [Coriobacteriia bacterium]